MRMALAPTRAPDVGSARSGQPARSARIRAADPLSSPATTTVRGPRRSSSTPARAAAGVPPLRLRFGGRRAGGCRPPRFGVGQQRLLELEVELGRTAPPGRDLRGRLEVRCCGVEAEVEAGGEDPEDAVLVGRLVGPGAAHGRGPVGGEEHEAPAGVRGLHDGGQQVPDGGARRRHHGDRRPRARRQAQGQEPGGPLVDPDVQPHVAGGVRRIQGRRPGRPSATRGRGPPRGRHPRPGRRGDAARAPGTSRRVEYACRPARRR